MGLLTNWTGDADGLSRTLSIIEGFAAGFMFPFAFLSQNIRDILNLLPFRYIFSFPLEVTLGQLNANAIGYGYLVLGIWSLGLIILFRKLSNVSMKYFSSHGG